VIGGALELEAALEPGEHSHPELEGALEQLEPARRQAILAVYAEGMTYEEAAEATGLPLGTLKRHLREGLGTLRRALRPRVRRRRR
jgi:RNA polymerase sigma factor (sigma-70 family)